MERIKIFIKLFLNFVFLFFLTCNLLKGKKYFVQDNFSQYFFTVEKMDNPDFKGRLKGFLIISVLYFLFLLLNAEINLKYYCIKK